MVRCEPHQRPERPNTRAPGIERAGAVTPRKLGHLVLGTTDYHYRLRGHFWYLKDPAGNFSEYYADMDAIVDDQTWTPEDFEAPPGSASGARPRRRRSCTPRTSPPS